MATKMSGRRSVAALIQDIQNIEVGRPKVTTEEEFQAYMKPFLDGIEPGDGVLGTVEEEAKLYRESSMLPSMPEL